MKLLIEIPEEKYNYFISNRNSYKRSIAESIINGQRLPDDCEILTKEAYADLCIRASKGNCSEIPTGSEKLSSELEKNSKKLEKATTKNNLGVDVPDNNVGNIDCISRADAIHAVSEALKHTFVEYEDIANKVIGKLPSVTPQWTPVSKESPTEFNRVICCTDEDEIFFATYLGKLDGSDCFDDEDGMMWEGDVIAWMSIPEPYRKEK